MGIYRSFRSIINIINEEYNIKRYYGKMNMNNNCYNKVLSEDYYDYITDYRLSLDEELKNLEICYNIIDSVFNAIYVPSQLYNADILNKLGYRVFVRLFGLLDYPSLEATGITKLRSFPKLNLRGKGVLIGIVDTGIDYTHEAFINADGTTKIVSIWDQTIQTGAQPEGVNYGTEFTREQINTALHNSRPYDIVPSNDEIGHGTSLAGLIVGNENIEQNFSGIVPDAELVVVKLKPAKKNLRNLYAIPEGAICFQENDIMLGVKYLHETAKTLNRPISICIGLGTSQGAHDVNGALSTYLSSIGALDGTSISIAAGNEGNNKHHYEGLLKKNTEFDIVDLNVGANETGFTMEIWGDAPNTFSIEVMSPSGEYVPLIIPKLEERRNIGFMFENTILDIYFQIAGSRSGAQLVIIRFRNPTEGIWRFTIRKINKALELRFNIWLPIDGFIGNDTYFIVSSPYTTLTSPANVFIPIVVTAYDILNNNLYINASRGYTRTNQIAPVITAPGVNILCPSPQNNYTKQSGTSIAAAFTAGVAAILFEWGKVRGYLEYLDGMDIKNLLIRGAKRDYNIDYPNKDWGYGIIDIIGTFESLSGNL